MGGQPRECDIQILLVEDNPLDVMMMRLALRNAGFSKDPTVIDDGGPAIALLRREEEYAEYPAPDFVILDLNLKRIDGPEVLKYIRQTEGLKGLRVAIVSSSPTDVMFTRAAEADCYFSKPSDLASFDSLAHQLLKCYSRTRKADKDTPPA